MQYNTARIVNKQKYKIKVCLFVGQSDIIFKHYLSSSDNIQK